MKNIFYLIQGVTKPKPIAQKPDRQIKTYVGATNYLYRQLQIHNHRWHPSERARQRPVALGTPGKLGWKPLAAVTGFPSEEYTNTFLGYFDVRSNNSPHAPRMTFKELQALPDPLHYRYSQMVYASNRYYEKFYSQLLSGELPSLTFHWQNKPLNYNFAPDIRHKKLDVDSIDRECYDPLDADDDRNYRRLRSEYVQDVRVDRLESLSKELNIPIHRVQDVLHQSRLKAKTNLQSQNQKIAKKANKFIHIHKPAPLVSSQVEQASRKEVI